MHQMKSWLSIAQSHDFSLHNFPFGIFYTQNNKETARVGSALGDFVLDLPALFHYGYLSNIQGLTKEILERSTLNDFLALGKPVCNGVRKVLQILFSEGNSQLKNHSNHVEKILIPLNSVKMLLPIKVNNYVDFYSSLDHATNVGKMFRDEKNPLLPNWKHIPIGYHGRAASIIPSGTNFNRPKGQLRFDENAPPVFAPSQQMDFELEMAFITNKNTELGQTFSPDEASNSIFGLALFNDWSARDIQKWEYVPLGPFLGKSFASSLSPWVVSLEALEFAAVPPPEKDVPELEYLKCKKWGNYDINLEVYLKSEKMSEPFLIAQTNYKYMYWNMFQQLAHMVSNGSPICVGDVYASGTISGPVPTSFGSLLELCWKGTKPIKLPDGTFRTFLQNGDTIIFKGYADKQGVRVGFGELSGTVLPEL